MKVDHRFEQGTRRLARTVASRPGGFVMDLRYAYDPAGNPTRVGDQVTGRAECYAYDGYRRLTDAWTPADGDCATAPGQAVLGGPGGFWNREVYDTVGNRLSQQATRVTGTGTTSTTTTAYTYPAPGSPRPHAPVSVTATRTGSGGTTPTGPTTDTGVFGYDEAGNTTSDPELLGSGRVLTWDAEGRLATVTSPAGTSSFTYTADGDRLVRRDPGATTVYLPGGQELTTTAGGDVKATRYYTVGGTTVAVRTETDDPAAFPFGQVTITVADPHGTGQLGFTTHTGELVRRYTDPYGNPLDQTGAWPTDRGFLNKPVDATGYTHIGARYYNPTHGRFLTVDPIMDLTDPAQWHAYTYANNNPTTYSDPTGLAPETGWTLQYYNPVPPAKPTSPWDTGGYYTPAGYSQRPTPDNRPGSQTPVTGPPSGGSSGPVCSICAQSSTALGGLGDAGIGFLTEGTGFGHTGGLSLGEGLDPHGFYDEAGSRIPGITNENPRAVWNRWMLTSRSLRLLGKSAPVLELASGGIEGYVNYNDRYAHVDDQTTRVGLSAGRALTTTATSAAVGAVVFVVVIAAFCAGTAGLGCVISAAAAAGIAGTASSMGAGAAFDYATRETFNITPGR